MTFDFEKNRIFQGAYLTAVGKERRKYFFYCPVESGLPVRKGVVCSAFYQFGENIIPLPGPLKLIKEVPQRRKKQVFEKEISAGRVVLPIIDVIEDFDINRIAGWKEQWKVVRLPAYEILTENPFSNRVHLQMNIQRLLALGYTQEKIANILKISRSTVVRYQRDLRPKVPKKRVVELDEYRELIQTWLISKPEIRGSEIHKKLGKIGYTGSIATVRRYVNKLKEEMNI